MSEINITYYNANDLVMAEYNPRQLTKDQYTQLRDSINRFGLVDPLIVNKNKDRKNILVGGHQRLRIAKEIGLESIPCVEIDLSYDQEKELNIRLNKNVGEWDYDALANHFDVGELTEWGFSNDELQFYEEEPTAGLIDDDEIPEVEEPITQAGDLWILGEHRLLCGDATKKEDVDILMDGEKAELLHSDPPYGMGKEKDGVINDNLYNEKLDQFQMKWLKVVRNYIKDNGSIYIWGNAPDLWRLWYVGGLKDLEHLELRNEIVWDKKAIAGMKSDLMHQYPEASERCLYIQIGKQFIGNINSEYFLEEWESLRSYMANEADSVGITNKEVKQITGTQMFSHWFTKSQFQLMSKKHYKKFQSVYPNNFKKSYDELKLEWKKGTDKIKKTQNKMRSYFDNSHDVMRDVWEFSRVHGDERHGHATPKPVDMMERIIKSSSHEKVIEPFLGSGSTLIACEKTNRKCYGMEIDPHYCDVIVKRWEEFSGNKAERIERAEC